MSIIIWFGHGVCEKLNFGLLWFWKLAQIDDWNKKSFPRNSVSVKHLISIGPSHQWASYQEVKEDKNCRRSCWEFRSCRCCRCWNLCSGSLRKSTDMMIEKMIIMHRLECSWKVLWRTTIKVKKMVYIPGVNIWLMVDYGVNVHKDIIFVLLLLGSNILGNVVMVCKIIHIDSVTVNDLSPNIPGACTGWIKSSFSIFALLISSSDPWTYSGNQ